MARQGILWLNKIRRYAALCLVLVVVPIFFAHAQSTEPTPRTRFEIKGVSPNSADPGEVINIQAGINLDSHQYPKVFFDSFEAVIVGINYTDGTIRAIVPSKLSAGTTPLILIQVGDDASFPYPGFRVSPTLFQRLTDRYASWVQAVSVIVIFASAIGTVLLFLRTRSRVRVLKEQTALLEPATRRRRERTADLAKERTLRDQQTEFVPSPIPPDELVRACIAGECVLFAGGRFPGEFGAPTASVLLATLLEAARERLSARDLHAMELALEAGEVESAKDLLSTKVESGFVQRELGTLLRIFSPSGPTVEVIRNIEFAGAITPNWDYLLDKIFVSRLTNASKLLPGVIQRDDFFLIKALGTPGDKDFSFSLNDYRQRIEQNPQLNRLLSSVFSKNSILYLGCEVNEIEQFIVQSQIRAHSDRRHFALVPADPLNEIRRGRMLSHYGIQLITYDPTDTESLHNFLRDLSAFGRLLPMPAVAKAQGVKPKIDEVTLVNIGPFKEVTIVFDKAKTTLLGNNGSGKSAALRAIALALCGDDDRVKDRAGTLLRHPREGEGELRGWVEIRAGKERYRTDLFRDRDRTVVRARQPSPLQDGSWVVLGFAAVRGVAGGGSGRRISRYPGPVVDDVLPLLGNGLDPRLEDLKQWIIDFHNKSEDRNVSRTDKEKARRLRDAIFEVIDRMLPGFDIKFHHLDHDDKRIWVRTADGILPIEVLSQGISSTIGWVGTLLARLYDIYEQSPAPEREPALLLIDEIDSHLHPAWQQLVMGTTADLFPNLSIIATTHSPLIVGALGEDGEVIRLLRSGDNILIEKMRHSYRGYRADQILTDPPFGLATSRDPTLEEVAAPLRAEFAKLARKRRSLEEDKRFLQVALRLEGGLAAPGETPEERAAMENSLFAKLASPDTDLDEVITALGLTADNDLRQDKR